MLNDNQTPSHVLLKKTLSESDNLLINATQAIKKDFNWSVWEAGPGEYANGELYGRPAAAAIVTILENGSQASPSVVMKAGKATIDVLTTPSDNLAPEFFRLLATPEWKDYHKSEPKPERLRSRGQYGDLHTAQWVYNHRKMDESVRDYTLGLVIGLMESKLDEAVKTAPEVALDASASIARYGASASVRDHGKQVENDLLASASQDTTIPKFVSTALKV